MFPRSFRLAGVVPLTAVVLLASSVAAQTATPVPDAPSAAAAAPNLPPVMNASVIPRRVVYLDALPSAGAQVLVDATASVDPEGQPLNYAADGNGDGVLSSWFFRPESAALVTMPGPFVITARAQDAFGAVGEQRIQMQARQFSAHVVNGSIGVPAAAFALVSGRPAFFWENGHGDLMITGNDADDGAGRWSTAVVKPVNVVRGWLGAREFNWG